MKKVVHHHSHIALKERDYRPGTENIGMNAALGAVS